MPGEASPGRGTFFFALQSQPSWKRRRKLRRGATRATRLIFRYGLEFCREC